MPPSSMKSYLRKGKGGLQTLVFKFKTRVVAIFTVVHIGLACARQRYQSYKPLVLMFLSQHVSG